MDDGVLPTIFAFEEPQQLLSPWVVTCFTINVIMGSGFLGVPHGFREAGIVLGPLVLLGVTVLQWTAACQLAQVITRANALLADADAAATLTPTLAPLAKSEAESAAKLRPSPPSLNVPSHTSYEMLMLCRLHLGAWAERFVMLSAALYMVGTLCARLRDEPPPPPHPRLRPTSASQAKPAARRDRDSRPARRRELRLGLRLFDERHGADSGAARRRREAGAVRHLQDGRVRRRLHHALLLLGPRLRAAHGRAHGA